MGFVFGILAALLERAMQALGVLTYSDVPYYTQYMTEADRCSNYESAIKRVGRFRTVEQFWSYYNHMQVVLSQRFSLHALTTPLQRPTDMSVPSDLHLFKDGIKPMGK